jgi:membrane dipeptidase
MKPVIFSLLFCLVLKGQTVEQRFQALMRDILIFDAHVDTPRYVVDEGYRFEEEHPYYETDLPRLKRGRVGAVFFGIYAQPGDYTPQQWLPRALECLDGFHEMVRQNSRDMEVAYTADDVIRIQRAGKVAALASLEGGHIIVDSPRILRMMYRLGVRYMTLAHFRTNNWADSATDVAVHNGLNNLGREIVAEMNRLGMIVDISHVSDKTVYDAVAASKAPVIASHSSVKAICDIPRNMNDEVIRAVAKGGGVIAINFHAGYLDKKAYEVYMSNRESRERDIKEALSMNNSARRWELVRAIQQRYYRLMPPVDAKLILRNIDHIVKLAGADHVGLGSDFDGISGMVPKGMEDVSQYPGLVKGMLEMGYSDTDIRKITGGNLIRVMRAAEAAASK